MSERKVLNKYFPPDFDPSKIPKGGGQYKSGGQFTIRLMTPFSMRCNSCGEYIYKRKKFNAQKETVKGEDYLGMKIFRFYIKCPRCSAEITFKTDPKNLDYTAEHGATRNFEPWTEIKHIQKDLDATKQNEEEFNPMKALENRTKESKREMEILDALDEIRTGNARVERVDSDTVLQRMVGASEKAKQKQIRDMEAEDEALARSIFQDFEGEGIKRIYEDDAEEGFSGLKDGLMVVPPEKSIPSFEGVFKLIEKKRKPTENMLGIVMKKPTIIVDESAVTCTVKAPVVEASADDSIADNSIADISKADNSIADISKAHNSITDISKANPCTGLSLVSGYESD